MKTSVLDFLHFNNPTNDQVNALKGIDRFVQESNSDQFMILRGAAGTGKTSIVSAIVGYYNNNGEQYKIAAPTGRAARIIGKKVGAGASTVHSMIFIPETDSKTGKVSFDLKIQIDESPTLYIIDEASMIPSRSKGKAFNYGSEFDVLTSLMKYVFSANPKNKILFIGDAYQLAPVGEEKSFALDHSFLQKKYQLHGTEYSLNEVKRQEDGSYILENATDIRKAIDRGESKHQIAGNKSNSIYEAVENYCTDLSTNGAQNTIAIGVSHKANKFFNDLVRTNVHGANKRILEPGDLMMVTRNWTRNGVFLCNGDQVKIIEIDWDSAESVEDLTFVALKFRPLFSDQIIEDLMLLETVTSLGGRVDQEKQLKLLQSRYIKNKIFRESENPEDDKYIGSIKLMYGHSITCHKAQGGEWDKVFINSWGIPNLKWQYTAVTRGISTIEHF